MATQSKKSISKRTKSELKRLESCYISDTTNIETVLLSPLTQKFVGCEISQDITITNPWAIIKKDKILEHIELFDAESEFYRLKKKIKKYPEDELMIGSSNFNRVAPVDFYLCTTVKARKRVENYIEMKHKMMIQKTFDSIYPKIGKWTSLGSEELLKSEMIVNNRVLLAVDIEADFPIHKNNTSFRLKLAEEIKNGYVELLVMRKMGAQFFWRRRVDKSTQSTLKKKTRAIQTREKVFLKQYTQCNYDSPGDIVLTKNLFLQLNEFLNLNANHMRDILNVNHHLNLYQNDYKDLGNNTSLSNIMEIPMDLKVFQDIINCRRSKVSCISWNALISGVVACAYSKNPLLSLTKKTHLEEILDPALENHLILIWFYNDNIRPKLYLHAKAEVTALSFCPYDENILVAGYSNGLIAVWDLTNRLIDSNDRTFLTDREENYHLLMSNNTDWIKKPLGFNHVFPVLTSDYQIGHTSPVTSIVWLPPCHYISEVRQYNECKTDDEHMQFITISLDGNRILVWDLKNPIANHYRKKPNGRKCRLATLPENLTKNISPLLKLKKFFKPVCKLYVNFPKSRNNMNPLTKMVMKNEFYNYNVKNPDTLDDIDAFTYFTMKRLRFNFDMSRKIILSTGLGVVQIAIWEGTNYKENSTEEVCKIDTLAVVHDGPIIVCEINAFFPDMILTVGGSVFAIWDYTKSKNALIWRKCKCRYQSGMWCLRHPLSVLLIRIDRCYEFWNVIEQSDKPIELFKNKGYDSIKLYGDSTKFHCRKKTFITADALGAFKVFFQPSETLNKANESTAIEYIDRLHKFKIHIENVKENCKKKTQHIHDEEYEQSEVHTSVISEPEAIPIKKSKMSNKVKYEHDLATHMRQVRLKRQKINYAEIKTNRLMCLEEAAKRRINSKKYIYDYERIMVEAQEDIFENGFMVKKMRRKHTFVGKERAKQMKRMYLESFKEIENKIIELLQSSKRSAPSQESCANMRKKYEKMAHQQMKFFKQNVILL